MTKLDFLSQLEKELSGFPSREKQERLTFYSEMIDDRMEEGLSEEEAVCAIGSVDEIISQILADIPLPELVKEKIRSKRTLRAWEIVLLAAGSPVWLSLAVAAFAVILSLYIALWSVIISLWAVFISVIACTLGGIAAGIGFACGGHSLTGIAIFSAAIICAGVCVFLFFGCRAATKGTLLLTKKIALGVKNCFIKKEEA